MTTFELEKPEVVKQVKAITQTSMDRIGSGTKRLTVVPARHLR
jgi:hypothetical protein